MSADFKTIVDVLVLVPEYQERSALIDSAIELVRSRATDKFRYTLVQFPEEDPRFDGIDEADVSRSVISQSSFFKGVFEPLFYRPRVQCKF